MQKYLYKKIICIICLLPVTSFGQAKGDSKVVVAMKDTTALMKTILLNLYEAGYSISEKDEMVGFVSTTPKPVGKAGTFLLKVRLLIKGDTVIISGQWGMNLDVAVVGVKEKEVTYETLKYGGMKGSPQREAWMELEAIGKKLGSISYSK